MEKILFEFEIFQTEFAKTTYDYFSDFIFPFIITVATILFSVGLSRKEFNKAKVHEENKEKAEDDALKRLISRNLKKVSNQIILDIENFKIQFIEKYDLEKGIIPQGMLLTFPELLSLSSIDTFRYERLYLKEEEDIDKIDQLYLTIGCIDTCLKSYEKLDQEIMKINDFLGENEATLLKSYKRYEDELIALMISFVEKEENLNSDTKKNVEQIQTIITGYESNANNFFELKKKIDNLENLNFLSRLKKFRLNSLDNYREDFLISYYKLQQEVGLFHQRVRYFNNRLKAATIQFHKFLNS